MKDEVPALYYAADFCLMPSRDEPFGIVDIEFAWGGALCIGGLNCKRSRITFIGMY